MTQFIYNRTISYLRLRYAAILVLPLYAFFFISTEQGAIGLAIDGLWAKSGFKLFASLLFFTIIPLRMYQPRARQLVLIFFVALPPCVFAILSFFSGVDLYLQAVNALFFLPLLFLDWRGQEVRYAQVMGTLSRLVILQVWISLLVSQSLLELWENRAMTGLLGNANSFALFCLCSFAWMAAIERRYFWAAGAVTGVLLSGSLVALVGLLLIAAYVFSWRSLTINAIVILSLAALFLQTADEEATRALSHALAKLAAAYDFLLSGGEPQTLSLTGRIEFLLQGMTMLRNDPAAIILGHPDGLVMYSGDGYYTAVVVTHGLPVLVSFVGALLILFFRTGSAIPEVQRFSKGILLLFLLYFVTNRILDYYPVALIFMLCCSYLSSHHYGGREASRLSFRYQ